MRISNQSRVAQTQRNISSLQGRIAQHQTNISTGRRIHKMSDNPTEAAKALKLSRQIRHSDQYSRNIDDAETWVNLADSALQGLDDRLSRAHNLLLQADSGVLGQDARSAVAQELRGIAAQSADLLNSTRAGHPIFGGTASADKPFDAAGNFTGNSNPVFRSASETVRLQVNIPGPEVAGAFNAADPSQGNIMQVLNAAADAIDAGAPANTFLTRVSELTDNVHSALATIGTRQNAIEQQRERLDSARFDLEASLSNAIDSDITTELLGLKSNEVAYQASIGVAARVLSSSILDFLR